MSELRKGLSVNSRMYTDCLPDRLFLCLSERYYHKPEADRELKCRKQQHSAELLFRKSETVMADMRRRDSGENDHERREYCFTDRRIEYRRENAIYDRRPKLDKRIARTDPFMTDAAFSAETQISDERYLIGEPQLRATVRAIAIVRKKLQIRARAIFDRVRKTADDESEYRRHGREDNSHLFSSAVSADG